MSSRDDLEAQDRSIRPMSGWRVPNTPAGHCPPEDAGRRPTYPARLVLEATGGYEARRGMRRCMPHGLPSPVVSNPRQVRDKARSRGDMVRHGPPKDCDHVARAGDWRAVAADGPAAAAAAPLGRQSRAARLGRSSRRRGRSWAARVIPEQQRRSPGLARLGAVPDGRTPSPGLARPAPGRSPRRPDRRCRPSSRTDAALRVRDGLAPEHPRHRPHGQLPPWLVRAVPELEAEASRAARSPRAGRAIAPFNQRTAAPLATAARQSSGGYGGLRPKP